MRTERLGRALREFQGALSASKGAVLVLAVLTCGARAHAQEIPDIPGLEDIREDARARPARSAEERLEEYAEKASLLPRLPDALAILVTIGGLLLLFAGRRLFRVAVVVYFAALAGVTGYAVGQELSDPRPLAGALIGAIAGAVVSFPFRVLLRSVIGALTAGLVSFVMIQAYTSSTMATVAAVGAALVGGGVFTYFFPTPLLIVGFSISGAIAVSVGLMSLLTEGAPERLTYEPWHILSVLAAAVVGTIIQGLIGISEEFDEDDDD